MGPCMEVPPHLPLCPPLTRFGLLFSIAFTAKVIVGIPFVPVLGIWILPSQRKAAAVWGSFPLSWSSFT